MDVGQALLTRSSSRAFIKKDVSKEILEKILVQANQSPSFMNTQPWEVYLVAGAKKEQLASKLYALSVAGHPPAPDFPLPSSWPPGPEGRMKEHRRRRFSFLGIDPDGEPERVTESMRRNFLFFEAPCAVIIALDKTLTSWSIFDLGLFVQSLLLAAHGAGLGACPQAMPTIYAQTIREELAMPENMAVSLVVSIGYPDVDAQINKYRSLRRSLDEFTHWLGF